MILITDAYSICDSAFISATYLEFNNINFVNYLVKNLRKTKNVTNMVNCSRKRFSEKQAEQWWAENRGRVYEQYNVRTVDKSSIGVGSEDLAR